MTASRPSVELRAEMSPSDLIECGGKGRGLVELMRLGVEVPPTLCVKASCFDRVLRAQIVKAQSVEILREALRGAALGAELERDLSAWLRRHPSKSWSVRSSSAQEDGHRASFAGQHLTCLHVRGGEALRAAIGEVWASAYADHALLYRARHDASLAPEAMAVLIQPMIAPHRAGVMFTRGAGERAAQRVITSVAGLAEEVVEGRSERAMTYHVERHTGYIVERTGSPLSALNDAELSLLVGLAEALERDDALKRWEVHDVEWALVSGEAGRAPTLYGIQLRPGAPRDVSSRHDRAAEVWTNANVGEALPGVGTPLTWSLIRRFSRRGFERAFGALGLQVPERAELVGSFEGRVYLNLSEFMAIMSSIPLLKPRLLHDLAGGGGVAAVEDTYEARPKFGFLLRAPLTAARAAYSQATTPWLARAWSGYFARRRDDFFARDLSRLSHRELARQAASMERLFDRNGEVMLAASANYLMTHVAWREALRAWGGERALSMEQTLLGGLEVKSAEPGMDLLQLGRLARQSLTIRSLIEEQEPAALWDAFQRRADHEVEVAQFLEKLRAFQRRHGHRAPREAELATPRWREDATFLMEVLKGFVTAPQLASQREVEQQLRRSVEERQRALSEIASAPGRGVIKALLGIVRLSAQRRESLRALVVEALDMYRALALECGERLTASGHLPSREHVFFLSDEELTRWLVRPGEVTVVEMRSAVLARAVVYAHRSASPDPPSTFLRQPNGRLVALDEESSRRRGDVITLYGLPGSPGRAAARARVLTAPSQGARLGHGEILVVPYADVGWTPLFLRAGGVVMNLGGPLSHACVVAREYAIATVVNSKRATELIEDGDWVTVDGDHGVVIVEKSGSS